MPVLRLQVSFPSILAGVGADAYVNTWHFSTVGATTSEAGAAAASTMLENFYHLIDGRFPDDLVDTDALVKAYDLSDLEPRAPVFEDTIALSLGLTSPMPPEVACCLSFRGTFASGVPKARRKGRVYIGPLVTTVNVAPGRPSQTFLDELDTAATALLAASDASTEATWVVWSPTAGVAVPVTGGWIDDEWDIQRRRSLGVTSRTEFGVGHG